MKFWSLRAVNMIPGQGTGQEQTRLIKQQTKLLAAKFSEYFDHNWRGYWLTRAWRGNRRLTPPHTERWCLPCEGSSPSRWSLPSSCSGSSLLSTLYPSHDDLARVCLLYQNVDYFPLMLSFNSLKWFIAIRLCLCSLLVQSNNYQVRTGLEKKINIV